MNAQCTSNFSDKIKWFPKESFVEVELILYSGHSAFFSPNFIVCFLDSDKAASICNAEESLYSRFIRTRDLFFRRLTQVPFNLHLSVTRVRIAHEICQNISTYNCIRHAVETLSS